MMSMNIKRLCVASGLIALAGAQSVLADDGKPSSDLISQSPIVAAHLHSSAVRDLGLRDTPGPEDYQLAGALLSIASDLDPQNAELARSIVEAAWLAGDEQMMMEATRRVIKIDPKDTVAQLRLVSSIINSKQTVEGRLEMFERFLGESGRSLDDSVRSRLALDAALLERERGNARGFVERLHQATKLDVSNKAAASLTAQYYSDSTTDPVTLLDYQIKLLFADPLDANVHLTIAKMLGKEGAFASAKRFLDNSIHLYQLESGRTPSQIEEIRLTLDWHLGGPKTILDDLNPVLADRRASAQSLIDSYLEAQLPIDDLIKPEDFRYDLNIDKLRLLAAYTLGDMEMAQLILDDIGSTVDDEFVAMSELVGEYGVDQAALVNRMVVRITEHQIMRAIVGLESEQIRAKVEEIVQIAPNFESFFAPIEPLALFAEGEYAQTIEAASAFSRSPALDLVVAMAHEKQGNIADAVELFDDVMRDNSLTAFGVFARYQLDRLGEGSRVVTTGGRQMIQISRTVPNWIDQMKARPSTFMFLDMEVEGKIQDMIGQPMVTVRLRNLSPIPLAVGPAQPLDSRILLQTRIDAQSAVFLGDAKAKVLGLDQRLRLRPREELVVRVRADSAQSSWLLSMQANASIRQRWMIKQGFRPRISDDVLQQMNPGDDVSIYGIVKSPLGLSDETNIYQRLLLDETRLGVIELISVLESKDEVARNRGMIAIAGRLLFPVPGKELGGQERSDLINALLDLYTRADNEERARMVLVLPHRHQVPEMIAFDDHVVSLILSDALIDSRVDPVLVAGVLMTRTDAVDSPVFEVLDQVSDERVLMIAGIIKSRIDGFKQTLGTVGPGVESMFPVKKNFGY